MLCKYFTKIIATMPIPETEWALLQIRDILVGGKQVSVTTVIASRRRGNPYPFVAVPTRGVQY
jgi:hypothetical protein